MYSLAFVVLVTLFGSIHCQFRGDEIPPECREKVMDVFFLLDSSTSIYINDYREQHQFVRDVINSLDISDRFTRVGALTFSDDFTRPVLRLTASRSQDEVLRSVTEIDLPYRTGVTNTHTAIRYVREFSEFRQGVTKVMVVITDGGSRQQGSTAREAELAREQGFYMYVVGVGQYRDEREWRAIASTPSDRFIFNISEFRQLSSVANLLPGQICPLPPLRINTCDVQQNVDMFFVAGPTQNNVVLDLVEELADSSRVFPGRQVTYKPYVDVCSPEVISATQINSICDRSRSVGALNDFTYTDLLQQVNNDVERNVRTRNRQVVVVFMDSIAYDTARFANVGSQLRSLDQQREVEVVFIGIGLSPRALASMAENVPKSVNFNLGDVSYQTQALGSYIDQTCQAINSRDSGQLSLSNN